MTWDGPLWPVPLCCSYPIKSGTASACRVWRGGPDIALDVRVTKKQERVNAILTLRNLLLLPNPDAQSSAWAMPVVLGIQCGIMHHDTTVLSMTGLVINSSVSMTNG